MKALWKLCFVLAISLVYFNSDTAAHAEEITYIEVAEPAESSSKQQRKIAGVSAGYEETYNNILQALLNLEESASFPADEMNYNDVGEIINQVLADHPEIFYFQHKGTLIYPDGVIKIQYKYSKSTNEHMINQLDARVNEVIGETIEDDDSDFEKVKAIHDYIVLNTAYDYENYLQGVIPDLSYSSYGLLVNGIAVCDGYAKAMKLLLERVGVETHYVTGYGNGGLHAWNLVKIDGKYYYVDATWNDPVPNTEGQVRYNHFLVPTTVLKKDHSWDEKAFPSATSTAYQYFQEFRDSQETEEYYYYSHNVDHKLYRINKDGTDKTEILDVRAPYFVVINDAIYFSNYSNGGYLYKSNTDGMSVEQINKNHSVDLSYQSGYLHFTNKVTNMTEKLFVGVAKERPVHDENSFVLFKEYKNVKLDKVWTIQLNGKLDAATVNHQTVYITDEDGYLVPDIEVTLDSSQNAIIVKNPENYKSSQMYTLYVTNHLKNMDGKSVKKAVKMHFETN